MKLEVGMYVRTIKGIDKVLLAEYAEVKRQEYPNHPSKSYWRDKIYLSKERYWRTSQNIIKASHNIIDLIEKGDILEINNEKYEVIYDESYEKLGILIPSRKELSIRHSALEYVFKKYNVSIVTKEQFLQMEYKVGE